MNPMQMLRDMFNTLKDAGAPIQDIFDTMLEWMAVQVSVEPGLSTRYINTEANAKLHEIFDVNVLKQDMQDWIGLFEEQLNLARPGYLTQEEAIAEAELETRDKMKMPQPVFYKNVGTGRVIMESFRLHGDAYIYYAREYNLRSYRIALFNSVIYNIPMFILYAERNQVIQTEVHSKNWFEANRWEPNTAALA